MFRYHVKYPGKVEDLIQILPLTRNYHPIQKRLQETGGDLSDQDVLVDEYVGIIDIALTQDEAILIGSMPGVEIYINLQNPGRLLSDPDGFDPLSHGMEYCNPWAQVEGVSNFPYGRRDIYLGNPAYPAVQMVWDRPYGNMSNYGGEMYSPTQHFLDIPRIHKLGITGKGVKVAIIDTGYSNLQPHRDIEAEECYEPYALDGIDVTTGLHGCGRMGDVGARLNGKGIIGFAPEATLYSGNFSNYAASISYLAQKGCRIFNNSYWGSYDLYVRSIVRKIVDDGGIFIVAAGNDRLEYLTPINPLASCPGAVAVTGSMGGGIYKFSDGPQFTSRLPFAGKGLDFAVPSVCVEAIPNYNGLQDGFYTAYANNNGTSCAAPIITGILALMMQKWPDLPGRVLVQMLKLHARSTEYEYMIPNLSFIK